MAVADLLRRVALPTSWRPLTADAFWRDHDVAITTEGGPSGRRHYEVYVEGWPYATRPSLAEAKAVVEAEFGPLGWSRKRLDRLEVTHITFGPTTEFTSPTTIWVASIPSAGAFDTGA